MMNVLRMELLLPLSFVIWICGAVAPATSAQATSGLELVNDDDLVQLIKEDEFLIVLFGKKV